MQWACVFTDRHSQVRRQQWGMQMLELNCDLAMKNTILLLIKPNQFYLNHEKGSFSPLKFLLIHCYHLLYFFLVLQNQYPTGKFFQIKWCDKLTYYFLCWYNSFYHYGYAKENHIYPTLALFSSDKAICHHRKFQVHKTGWLTFPI